MPLSLNNNRGSTQRANENRFQRGSDFKFIGCVEISIALCLKLR